MDSDERRLLQQMTDMREAASVARCRARLRLLHDMDEAFRRAQVMERLDLVLQMPTIGDRKQAA